jgi:hypothetical protein
LLFSEEENVNSFTVVGNRKAQRCGLPRVSWGREYLVEYKQRNILLSNS